MTYDIIMAVIKNNYDTKLCYKKGGANGKENNCEIWITAGNSDNCNVVAII